MTGSFFDPVIIFALLSYSNTNPFLQVFLLKRSLSSRQCTLVLILFTTLSILTLLWYGRTHQDNEFRAFAQAFFLEEVQANPIHFHYTIDNPSAYGVDESSLTLPVYQPGDAANEVCALSLAREELGRINPGALNEENRRLYELLDSYLLAAASTAAYPYFSEPLSPSSGLPSELPILFSEYRLDDKADIENYLSILTQIPSYFEGLLVYEQEKADAGLFMSDLTADRVIRQCSELLDASDLKGRVLLNLDSEDEGIFLTGCAGGATVSCKIPVKWTKEEGIRYRISIENLTGGHSGAEIHKGRANANVLMGRLLYTLTDEMNMWIASLAGGEKDNAIARFCHAEVAVAEAQAEAFERCVEKMAAAIKREYALREPEACIYAEKMGRGSAQVLQPVSASRVILALVHMPDGVQKMEEALKGEVRTSLNLGQIALSEECFTFVSSVRSSLASEKTWLLEKLQSLAMLLGGECVVSGEYPAWEYRPDSRIRELIVRVYEEQTGKKAKICSIHAGLECGILADKLPGLDCVSYGPQMQAIHTTGETLSISSVQRTWELTLGVLAAIK